MAEKVKKKLYPKLQNEEQETPSISVSNNDPSKHNEPIENSPLIKPVTPLIRPSSNPPNDPQKPVNSSLYPNLEEEMPPCPVQTHYKTFLAEYIEKIEEIMEKFSQISKRAASHHYKSNCAKVSGTVVSTTGVALVMGSLVWAPLTAGSSLVLGAGGAVMSVTGSLTNVVTDYIDYRTTKVIVEDIKLLLKEKELFDGWMKKSLVHFNECIDQLMAEGLTRDVAISTMVEGIAKGVINIMEKPNNQVMSTLSSVVKLHHIEHLALETLPVLGKTFHISEKSFQFVYNILGLTGKTVPTLMKEFAKLSGFLSVAFALTDISLLVKDLCSEHPSVELIEKVMRKLEDERRVLCDLLDILKDVGAHKEGIFERALRDMEMIEDKEDLLEDFVIVNEEEYHDRAGIMVQ